MPEIDATRLINAARQFLDAMDSGRSTRLWERASPVALARTHPDALAGSVDAQRSALGVVRSRSWAAINRRASDGRSELPAGDYANVVFDVVFDDGRRAQELITLRHDADGVWRLAGYALH